jgi:hypothetical protein
MSSNLRKTISAALATDNHGHILATPGIDINNGHALVVSDYERVLYDYRLRNFPIDINVNSVRATGYPHSFNEQTKIPSNTTAVDPKLGFGTTVADYAKPSADLDTDYGRDNWKNAFVKAYASRIEYDYFTRKWEENYGAFEDLVAKDYNDMIVDYVKTTTNDFFNGRSTSLDDTSSTYKLEYCGILNQITDVSAISASTLIADALNTKIANLQARLDYDGMPDVLCMNSATYNLLVQEERARQNYIQQINSEIVPGWKVPSINLYHMNTPIMITPFIKPTTSGTTVTHKIVALNQSQIDKIWMFKDGPEFFDFADPNMPLGNTRLLTNKAMLSFQNYILRGPSAGFHFILTKDVTTA